MKKLIVMLNLVLQLGLTAAETRPRPAEIEFVVKTSLLDAVSNSLSQELSGMDFHSYQRQRLGLARGEWPAIGLAGEFARKKLCRTDQSAADWLNLECRWHAPLAGEYQCLNKRCDTRTIADFVVRDSKLMAALQRAIDNPCDYIPDAKNLNDKAGIGKVHSTGMFQISEISSSSLRCDLDRPIRGALVRLDGADYRIEYKR